MILLKKTGQRTFMVILYFYPFWCSVTSVKRENNWTAVVFFSVYSVPWTELDVCTDVGVRR